MTKRNDKKRNRVWGVFCFRPFKFSSRIYLRILDSYNRVIFGYMENQRKMNLAIDILEFMWDLCKNLFA